MFLDGLEDAYHPGRLMGTYAEDTASHYGFTPCQQDEFAMTSLAQARATIKQGRFKAEIVPVTVSGRKGDMVIADDEQPGKANPTRFHN